MASRFFLSAILAFLSLQLAFSSTTPSPSPESPAADSPLHSAPSHSPPSPSPESRSPLSPPSDSPVSSPPSPPPSDLPSPASTPAPAPSPSNTTVPSPSPAPAPAEVGDINHSDNEEASGDGEKGSSGMSGGKKAGIALGVIAAAGVVGIGGLVYKKRQDNIRRSRYGSAAAATREFL